MYAALAVFVATAPARADEPGGARDQRDLGKAVTYLGLGLGTAGTALLTAAMLTPTCAFAYGAPEEGPCAYGGGGGGAFVPLFAAGIAVSIAGDAAWITGTAHWTIAAHRLAKLQRTTAAR